MVRHTVELGADELREARALMDLAFNHFSDADWDHALGGMHAVVEADGRMVAHGSIVQRRLWTAGRSLRTGYVEAVAVHPDHQRRGLGARILAELEAFAPAYDVLALSATVAGVPLYGARGWQPWRGPTWTLGPEGRVRTDADDGAVHVLGADGLDLDADVACEWRDGEVW